MNAIVDWLSVLNILTSHLSNSRFFNFSTTISGSEYAIILIGQYEKIMPLDDEINKHTGIFLAVLNLQSISWLSVKNKQTNYTHI